MWNIPQFFRTMFIFTILNLESPAHGTLPLKEISTNLFLPPSFNIQQLTFDYHWVLKSRYLFLLDSPLRTTIIAEWTSENTSSLIFSQRKSSRHLHSPYCVSGCQKSRWMLGWQHGTLVNAGSWPASWGTCWCCAGCPAACQGGGGTDEPTSRCLPPDSP